MPDGEFEIVSDIHWGTLTRYDRFARLLPEKCRTAPCEEVLRGKINKRKGYVHIHHSRIHYAIRGIFLAEMTPATGQASPGTPSPTVLRMFAVYHIHSF